MGRVRIKMKTPKTFIAKKLSYEKLESLLGEKIRKITGKDDERKNYKYHCDICGERAGSIEIFFKYPKGMKLGCIPLWLDPLWPEFDIDICEPPFKNKPRLVTHSFMGTATIPMSNKSLESIAEHLDNRDLKPVLEELKGNDLAFYCPTCDKCYCKSHWLTETVWEDCGLYDHTIGFCLKGHKRMIDD